jgi:hypothetical protein
LVGIRAGSGYACLQGIGSRLGRSRIARAGGASAERVGQAAAVVDRLAMTSVRAAFARGDAGHELDVGRGSDAI